MPLASRAAYAWAKGDSQYFQTWNIEQEERHARPQVGGGAKRLFEQLVGTADAVVEQSARRPAGQARPRLCDPEARSMPAIVCLHISAYGRDNERTAWPGYDFLMQAEAGLMSLTGEPDGPPARFGASMIDYMTGVTGDGRAAQLPACAPVRRGKGCDVDASLFDVALHQLAYSAAWYLNEGDVSPRLPRSAHRSIAPVQTFPTADGWIFVMCMTEKFWENLIGAIGRDDLGRRSALCQPSAAARAPCRPDPGARRRAQAAHDAGDGLRVLGLAAGGAGARNGPGARSAFVAEVGMVGKRAASGALRPAGAGQSPQDRRASDPSRWPRAIWAPTPRRCSAELATATHPTRVRA